nr:MAG TPA: hypothetical protein [Caudoviricetes sp.]
MQQLPLLRLRAESSTRRQAPILTPPRPCPPHSVSNVIAKYYIVILLCSIKGKKRNPGIN